jgi:hypothetical protein
MAKLTDAEKQAIITRDKPGYVLVRTSGDARPTRAAALASSPELDVLRERWQKLPEVAILPARGRVPQKVHVQNTLTKQIVGEQG